jgi:hypothetical protein
MCYAFNSAFKIDKFANKTRQLKAFVKPFFEEAATGLIIMHYRIGCTD